jgi:hypothetical protein
MRLNFLDSGSRYPGLDPGLPGMTAEVCNELSTHRAARIEAACSKPEDIHVVSFKLKRQTRDSKR